MSRMFWFVVHEQQKSILCDELISQAAFAAIDKMNQTGQFSIKWQNETRTMAYKKDSVDDYLEDPITHENKWWLIIESYSQNIFESHYNQYLPDFDYKTHMTLFPELAGDDDLTDVELSHGLFSEGWFC